MVPSSMMNIWNEYPCFVRSKSFSYLCSLKTKQKGKAIVQYKWSVIFEQLFFFFCQIGYFSFSSFFVSTLQSNIFFRCFFYSFDWSVHIFLSEPMNEKWRDYSLPCYFFHKVCLCYLLLIYLSFFLLYYSTCVVEYSNIWKIKSTEYGNEMDFLIGQISFI